MEDIEIKRLTTENDIAGLLKIDDDVENFFPCTKGEWIQWLMKHIENPRIFVLGCFKDNNIFAYLVAINSVIPPITKHVYIAYMYSPNDFNRSKEMLQKIIEWTNECNAKQITTNVKEPKVAEMFGFKRSKYIKMEMDL